MGRHRLLDKVSAVGEGADLVKCIAREREVEDGNCDEGDGEFHTSCEVKG